MQAVYSEVLLFPLQFHSNEIIRASDELKKMVGSNGAGGAGPISSVLSLLSFLEFDRFQLKVRNNLTAKEAIALILIGSVKPTPAFHILLEELGSRARRYQYSGRWLLVHELINIVFLGPTFLFEQLFKRGISSREVFGRLLKECAQRASLKVYVSPLNKGRVNKPQRKRGYDDKGSAKPAHCWLPTDVHLGPNPLKLDLTPTEKKRTQILNWLYG